MAGKVLVVGSINVDYTVETDRVPKLGETVTGYGFSMNFGGKGANQATAIAKQGCEVRMLGAVGRDRAGDMALQNLRDCGIGCEGVLRVDAPTGAAVITVCHGDNHIILDAGANALVTPEVVKARKDLFSWADVIVMQYEIPIESVLEAARLAKSLGKTVILNPAPVKEVDEALYRFVDWIIPNEFEAELITGIFPSDDESAAAALEALRQKGASDAIVTLGRRGSAYTNGDRVGFCGVYRVEAKDSTAAGDSFIGGLCTKMCEGEPIDRAVSYASAVSAITVSRRGAACSIPSADEIIEFLKTAKVE